MGADDSQSGSGGANSFAAQQTAITPSAPARTKGGAWEGIASRYNGQAHHQILNRFMYSAIHFSGF